MNKKNINLITALYCRLSIDDGTVLESMSIANQKKFLEDYAIRNRLSNLEFYIDDGYTGRNFNRPSFQRLVKDIESGLISTIIVKDLSRLGRNYIEVGMYTDVFFPNHNIRFIAINDGVDSFQKTDFDITPFKNILNDMYSRDISKKVSTGMMIRSKQGKYTGGPPPFGLMRDPDDHGHLIPDPEYAPTVRYIFDLALSGKGLFKIARQLQFEKVPKTSKTASEKRYLWTSTNIFRILRNPLYKGAHVVCKSHQTGIRTNKMIQIPKDEWEIIENAHEAIIPADEWERVQAILETRPKVERKKTSAYENPFDGSILCCADCKATMRAFTYNSSRRADINRFTHELRTPVDKTLFRCETYIKHSVTECSSHKIEARHLHDIVLSDIKQHAEMAIKDPDTFFNAIAKKLKQEALITSKSILNEKNRLIARNKDLEMMYSNLYLDKSKGIISESRFIQLSSDLDIEQESNNKRIHEIDKELQKTNSSSREISNFIDEISKYTDITSLTSELVHRLIKKIYIGEPIEIDGILHQEITIIYLFVGNISEPTIYKCQNPYHSETLVKIKSA